MGSVMLKKLTLDNKLLFNKKTSWKVNTHFNINKLFRVYDKT